MLPFPFASGRVVPGLNTFSITPRSICYKW
jgi:hypothetical protein